VSNESLARAALSADRRVSRVLNEGDMVVIHSEVVDGEEKPTGVAFDLWEIKDSAIADHWVTWNRGRHRLQTVTRR
jgi:predicted SnoaL-like aldol condensation-catalyzing enzyme